jgi:hypothetical protein
MLRPLENVLTPLTSAGLSGVDALHIYRVVFGCLHGHILTELQEVIERPEETEDVLRLGLQRLTVTEFPQVQALASALANSGGAAELDRGLDLLFSGLTATLIPPDGPSRLEATAAGAVRRSLGRHEGHAELEAPGSQRVRAVIRRSPLRVLHRMTPR